MDTVVALTFGAFSLAMVYAAANVGFVLLFRGTGVPNFAHGALIALGAFIASSWAGPEHYWAGLIAMMLAMGAIGVICYYVLMRWLFGVGELYKVVVTFLLSAILINLVLLIWGTDDRAAPVVTRATIDLLGARIPVQTIISSAIVLLAAIVVLGATGKTMLGKRMEAVATDEVLAAYRGIRVHVIGAATWAMAAMLAGLAGLLYSQGATVSLGLADLVLLAFPAVAIGGLQNIKGAVIASVALAGMLTIAQYHFGSIVAGVACWAALLACLLYFPQGLFGTRQMGRL